MREMTLEEKLKLNISHGEKTYDLTPYIKNSTSGVQTLDGIVRFAKSENTRYIKLPFIRLIYRDGKYVGFYHPKLRKVLK